MNEAKTFYIIDLDRTLLDTEKSARLFEDVVADHDVDISHLLTQELERANKLGESFSMQSFVADKLPVAELNMIEAAFSERAARIDLLLPHAQKLLDLLDHAQKDYGILTYGSVEGQKLKIRVSGLGTIPHSITQIAEKGEVIASWRNESGQFIIPTELSPKGLVVEYIVLVDDRVRSFDGLPDNAAGFWVANNGFDNNETTPLRAQKVTDLEELLGIILNDPFVDKA